jgi:hypothetical protein
VIAHMRRLRTARRGLGPVGSAIRLDLPAAARMLLQKEAARI